jgi:CMP-N,N'-diacetyllegionaminic acid synthase
MNHTYYAIIPARSGSKTVPHKNIRDFHGHPLLAWSIIIAQRSPLISDIYVTTDSEDYARIAQQYGAKTILRPHSCADDLSTDLEFFQHLQPYIFPLPDAWIQLRPTCPIRNIDSLNHIIRTFDHEWDQWTSLRTVVPIDKSPFKMYITGHQQQLIPLFGSFQHIHEPYNQCRQILPPAYLHNGNIDIVKNSTIVTHHSVTGPLIRSWIDNDTNIDIDTEQDWINALNLSI